MIEIDPQFGSLLELLRHRSYERSGCADDPVFSYLENGDAVTERLTFRELDARARNVAAHLQSRIQPGDRVMLGFAPSIEFIVAFFGCIYAGAIAVPAAAPTNARTLPRLWLIAQDAGIRIILTTTKLAEHLVKWDSDGVLRGIPLLTVDDLADHSVAWTAPSVFANDLAFLQYTSGSTGDPKGVMVTHANVLANAAHWCALRHLERGDVIVSWLPPHHDFGLIGGILLPVYAGCHCVQFPPAVFLMRPFRWLKVMSDYRARLTGAPNFAYDICVTRVPDVEKAQLDLSSLRTAVNGAERVRYRTMVNFARAFSSTGLRPDVMTPAYGLAESTLLVTASSRRDVSGLATARAVSRRSLAKNDVKSPSDDADRIDIVECGTIESDRGEIIVVDPTSLIPKDNGEVGEIWLRNPSIGVGYWGKLLETERVFGAKAQGSEYRYLRTGDLGFIADGSLYISGRTKEVIILGGRNVYPQDLEATIEQTDPAFRSNGCAVFQIDIADASRIVIVQEIESRQTPRYETVFGRIRAELAELHEVLEVSAILLVKAGQLPRTSSGKIQRGRCRQLFEAGAFESLWRWTPAIASGAEELDATAQRLLKIWREVLNVAEVGPDDDFFSMGGHSLRASQVLARVRVEFGVDVPLRALFDAPTIRGLARIVNDLPIVDHNTQDATIRSFERSDSTLLSFAQRRLWFIDQFEHASSLAYHLVGGLRFKGSLDVDALRSALNRIVERHEILRTTFSDDDGTVRQVISPESSFALVEHNLSGLPQLESELEIQRLSEAEVRRPFDLSKGPLIRGRLLRISQCEYILLIGQHHIVSDGWSINVLESELLALYTALVMRKADTLPPLTMQYSEYVGQQCLAEPTFESRVSFWAQLLSGMPLLTNLPTDRPRPTVQSFAGARLRVDFSAELIADLRRIGQKQGVTLFMTVLAAWAVLIARYSGQSKVVIGVPVANRREIETEALIGFFVNTLALPVCIDDDLTVAELLARIKATIVDAYPYQDVPFERVVEAVNPPRSLSYSPIFQVMLAIDNTPRALRQDVPGLSAERIEVPHVTSQVDLSLLLNETDAGLSGCIEYATDLFDRETICDIYESLIATLQAISLDVERYISELSLLTPKQSRRLLELNVPTPLPNAAVPVHMLFESQAARDPEAIAVVYEDQRLSYGELNRRANRLAHALQGLGVKPDDRVALCVERGIAMVVGVLGILKSGGAYVPLDPGYPRERLEYMLSDSKPVAMVTQAAVVEGMPAGTVPTVVLEADGSAVSLAGEADGNPTVAGLTAQHLAYVIYTSGSTGQPKGVMVEHASVARLFAATEAEFGFGRDDVWTLFHSIAFDFSVWELWGALIYGGRLVVVSTACARSPHEFYQLLCRERVSVLNQTPSAFRQLMPVVAEHAEAHALRVVVFGGEALELGMLGAWIRHTPLSRTALVNMYGITEITVHGTYRRLSAEDIEMRSASIIGRPLPDLQFYLLDARRNLVPLGVGGEIYVGGAGIARGYLHRDELTQERFVADPFGPPGGRLYRTGDLARYRADGTLEYLGRNDFQVKIRGFRIELGEIEAQLGRCAGVRDAVVVVREDNPGDQRLVAYVVAQEGVTLSAADLRAQLSRVLSEYMLPNAFVNLEHLPLTANGKLDRSALPPPDGNALVAMRVYEAPIGPIETAIAEIWQELLGVLKIGRNDHFFELGGHSLKAVQVISRLRRLAGLEIPVRELFAHPQLSEFANTISHFGQSAQPAIEAIVRCNTMPLSWAQQRIWFLSQLEPGSAFYNIPVCLRLKGHLRLEALGRALQEIVARHEILRASFEAEDGVPFQRFAMKLDVKIQLHDLTTLSELDRRREADRLIAAEAQRPFNLNFDPLLRASMLRLAEDEHEFLLTVHHIVSDGWSMSVIVQELTAIYTAFAYGRIPPLLALEMQYADYAAWQHKWMQSGALEAELGYWRDQLSGVPEVLELPIDRPRPEKRGFAGAALPIVLNNTDVNAIQALGLEESCTTFVIMLAVFQIVLGQFANASEFIVGIDVSNRDRLETEALVGLFINQLPLRVRVDSNLRFRQFLRGVRKQVFDGQAHNNVPFDKIVDAVRPARSLEYHPLFQVKLAYQNMPTVALQLPELTLELVETHDRLTKECDITFFLNDMGKTIVGALEYSSELFDRSKMVQLAENYVSALRQLIGSPDMRIDALDCLSIKTAHSGRKIRAATAAAFSRSNAKTPIAAGKSLVELSEIGHGQTLPLMIRPSLTGIDLVEWAAQHRTFLDTNLVKHGAILFRGFGVTTSAMFEKFALSTCEELYGENGEHPLLAGKVYKPVFFPTSEKLLWHNENTFNAEWPRKLWFACTQPPDWGGETPLVDVRRVYDSLPSKLRSHFVERGIMYVRNYGHGIGRRWQQVFGTESRTEVESIFRRSGVMWEWWGDDYLRTRSVRPAAAPHPLTGELCWFNQAQHWHISCVDPETGQALNNLYSEAELPRNCYYGDGSAIEDDTMREILAVYAGLEVAFPWQKGDVVMLDNMITAHARNPFGGERRLMVAMGEMIQIGF